MKKTLVFATNNKHKLDEIRQILGETYHVVSLAEIGCHTDIPETGTTLEENALQKARFVFENYHIGCFADDTGLEVDGGEPGVYSARYAGGEGHDSEANMQKLLENLGNNNNRKARFRTVIALITTDENSNEPQTKLFEGIVEGHIAYEKAGSSGFGYDPIFVPDGYEESFAQLGDIIKNQISHRSRAVKKLVAFLTCC